MFARAAAATLIAAAVHGAGGGSGSIVIKLSTDPSPPGVDWSYTVAGQSFRLGTSGSSKTVAGLADGTYRLVEIEQAHPTLFSLPATPAATYLDVAGAEPSLRAARYPSIERELESARPRPTVYFHLAYQPASQRVAIEYWLLYLYNDFYDKHEADWEGVTVFLQNGAPLGATYSQHQGRKWLPWTSLARSGTHPIVYVARGSHAEYPKTGS